MTPRTSTPTTPASCGFSLTAEAEQLVRRGAQAAAEADRDLQVVGVVGRIGGEDEFEQVAQGEGGAEAGHDKDDDGAAPVAQRAEKAGIDEQGEPRRQRNRDDGGQRQRPSEGERPDGCGKPGREIAERAADRESEIGAPGDELPMREIREAQDGIRQSHADRAEPDHRARDQPVHQELRSHRATARLP
jgi:hypothetical protein